ncbi:MAG: hypothetical protein ACTSRI_09450 [Promethearchaeota archaeon]
MAYDSFEPRIFPLFLFYIILSIFTLVVVISMFRKWRERKAPAALHITLVYIFLLLALSMLIIGMAEAVITGYFKEIYRFTFPMAECCVVIADIFLFFFASKITDKGQKLFIPLIIIGIALIIMIFLPWNWWGHPVENYEGQLNIRLYTSLFFVGYSIALYLVIAIICLKTKKQAKVLISRVGLSLFFYSVMCMICFFVFLMLDNLLIVLFDHPGYSEFIYIAWFFTLLFAILSYFSLAMPKLLIKWINKKESDK